ncbi:ATP-dependent protease ATPase subunit HslU [Pacificimonas sp. ICDLI1SI03]
MSEQNFTVPDRSIEGLTPRAVVAELDRYIVGQKEAKRAVAVALRNRWRRQQLDEGLREEVNPKNILMIGPTGCGKTEISRRLAKLAEAPFIKIEATKFTEVGYVGRDVEQIVRDLVEEAIRLVREQKRAAVKADAEKDAEERLIDALAGKDSTSGTREKMREKLANGELSDRRIEIDVEATPSMPFEMPGMGGQVGMIDFGNMFGKMGKQQKKRKLTVAQAFDVLLAEESDKRLDDEEIAREAIEAAEQNGIVFLDEIDKIAVSDVRGGSVSREGVQRDLLPLIEGTTVSTKHGAVKTDHVLFIASGAFHVAKPSDLLPELQGRLPIRVELKGLTEEDFRHILKDTEASLITQYRALIGTEGVDLVFTEDAINRIAKLAADVNASVENIGARRLQTVLEKLVEEISFSASEQAGQRIEIDAAYVDKQLAEIVEDQDLSKYVL